MRYNFPVKVCNTVVHKDDGEIEVRNDQAITPSQMSKLTNQGKAVSMASLDNVSYFDNIGDFEGMPLENTRGVDINTLWEASESSKSKIKEFKQHQKRNSHVSNPTQAIAE